MDIPIVVEDDVLFAHTIDEAIGDKLIQSKNQKYKKVYKRKKLGKIQQKIKHKNIDILNSTLILCLIIY